MSFRFFFSILFLAGSASLAQGELPALGYPSAVPDNFENHFKMTGGQNGFCAIYSDGVIDGEPPARCWHYEGKSVPKRFEGPSAGPRRKVVALKMDRHMSCALLRRDPEEGESYQKVDFSFECEYLQKGRNGVRPFLLQDDDAPTISLDSVPASQLGYTDFAFYHRKGDGPGGFDQLFCYIQANSRGRFVKCFENGEEIAVGSRFSYEQVEINSLGEIFLRFERTSLGFESGIEVINPFSDSRDRSARTPLIVGSSRMAVSDDFVCVDQIEEIDQRKTLACHRISRFNGQYRFQPFLMGAFNVGPFAIGNGTVYFSANNAVYKWEPGKARSVTRFLNLRAPAIRLSANPQTVCAVSYWADENVVKIEGEQTPFVPRSEISCKHQEFRVYSHTEDLGELVPTVEFHPGFVAESFRRAANVVDGMAGVDKEGLFYHLARLYERTTSIDYEMDEDRSLERFFIGAVAPIIFKSETEYSEAHVSRIYRRQYGEGSTLCDPRELEEEQGCVHLRTTMRMVSEGLRHYRNIKEFQLVEWLLGPGDTLEEGEEPEFPAVSTFVNKVGEEFETEARTFIEWYRTKEYKFSGIAQPMSIGDALIRQVDLGYDDDGVADMIDNLIEHAARFYEWDEEGEDQ